MRLWLCKYSLPRYGFMFSSFPVTLHSFVAVYLSASPTLLVDIVSFSFFCFNTIQFCNQLLLLTAAVHIRAQKRIVTRSAHEAGGTDDGTTKRQ